MRINDIDIPNSINAVQAKVDTTINADIQTVWDCLVKETTKWWHKGLYTNEKTKGFHIQAQLGGMAYEDFGGCEGLTWSKVIGVDSPNSIQFKGLLSPDFGGPAISYTAVQLAANESGTIFKLTDTLFGAVYEGNAAQIESGWKMIIEVAFKN